MTKIDFVILGAQKSASTFLQTLISDHPDVFMPSGETPYFQDPDYHRSSLDDYIKVSSNNTFKAIGIKRPNYIGPCGNHVAERVYMHNSQCILIAVLRNPADRFISHFYHQVKNRQAPNVNINNILPAILNLDPCLLSLHPRLNEISENGLYFKYLKPYYSLFSPENIIVFTQEDLIDNPRLILRNIFSRLGVDYEYIPSENCFTKKPQRVDYRTNSLFFWRIISLLAYRYSDDMRIHPVRLSYLRKALISLVKIIRHVFDRLNLFGPNKKPPLTNKSIDLLARYYHDDILATEDLTGLNLSAWKEV